MALPRDRGRRIGVARCAPVYNPQNVPDPLVMPSPSFSPEEAVRAQLDALRNNDEPWVNHGIQTAYEFALDAGGMDRSYYFGFSKDLYHFDHFLGMFGNRLGALVSNSSYELSPAVEAAPGVVSVTATVHDGSGQSLTYKFELAKRELGRKKGSWMVKSLIPVP